MSHRPEVSWAKELMGRSKEENENDILANDRKYILSQLALAGQVEHAILKTIGESQLLERLIYRDRVALRSHGGRHILNWATFNPDFDVEGTITHLLASPKREDRALGLLIKSGQAICDENRSVAFNKLFTSDRLCRQVAAYRAVANLTSDRVGNRAAAWLMELFDDDDKDVRREAGQVHWGEILDGNNHLRHQALSTSIDPFHAAFQSRTDLEVDGLDGFGLKSVGVEGLSAIEHAPGNAGEARAAASLLRCILARHWLAALRS